jgi:hypothetical protein
MKISTQARMGVDYSVEEGRLSNKTKRIGYNRDSPIYYFLPMQEQDHDRNEPALIARVYAQHGYRDLLIKQVWNLDPELSVSSINQN